MPDIKRWWAKVGYAWAKQPKEAEAAYNQWQERLLPKAGMGRIFDRYEAEIIPAKPSEATRKSNLQELKKLRAVFAECEPSDITVHYIYRYMDARGVQSKTQANHELATLKHIYRYAQRWGNVEHNPADPVTKFKLKPRDRYITHSEFTRFLKHTSP